MCGLREGREKGGLEGILRDSCYEWWLVGWEHGESGESESQAVGGLKLYQTRVGSQRRLDNQYEKSRISDNSSNSINNNSDDNKNDTKIRTTMTKKYDD